MSQYKNEKLVNRLAEEMIFYNTKGGDFRIKSEYISLKNLYKYYTGKYDYKDAGLVFISNFFIELDKYIIKNSDKSSYDYFITEFKKPVTQLYNYFKLRLKTSMALGVNTGSDKIHIDNKEYYIKTSGVSLDKENKNKITLYDVVEDKKLYNTKYIVSEKELMDFMWSLNVKELEKINKTEYLSTYNKIRIQVKLMMYLIKKGKIDDSNYYLRLICVLKSKVVGRGKNTKQINNILKKEGIPYTVYNKYISDVVPYGEEMSKYVNKDYKKIMREYFGVKLLKTPEIMEGGDSNSKIIELTPQGLFRRISVDGVEDKDLRLNEEGEVVRYYIDINDAKFKEVNK